MEKQSITIHWSTRSRDDLQRIYNFLTESNDLEKAESIVQTLIDNIVKHLRDPMYPGQPDLQFIDLHSGARKLIFGVYKISFIQMGSSRQVIRVFDTRRHPDKNL